MMKENCGQFFTATAVMLASIAFAAMMPSAMAAKSEAAAVFEKAKASVVVRVFDAGGKQLAPGSGVATAKNEMTTNCHVVENAVRVAAVRQRLVWLDNA